MKNPIYAIIGAGPSGLAMAKVLSDNGIAYHGYEASDEVGGLWDISRDQSPLYPSTHLISSKSMTEFEVFPMGVDVPEYPHHSYVLKYFKDFAAHFDLYKSFTFNAKVKDIEEVGEGWSIQLEDGDTQFYDGVILATGTFSKPYFPEHSDKFEGLTLHSADLKSYDVIRDKDILVVGGGNSGCDIAVEAASISKSVRLSVNKGNYFVPKYIRGKPYDTISDKWRLPRVIKQCVDAYVLKNLVGDTTRFGFPAPKHKIYQLHPIVNTRVLYQIGHGHIKVYPPISSIEGKTVYFESGISRKFDVIVYATGFQLNFPYIKRELLNWEGFAPNLYLNIFNPKHLNLLVMGLVEATGLGWQGRYEQAVLIGAYLAAKVNGRKSAERFERRIQGKFPDTSAGYHYLDTPAMAYYVNKTKYKRLLKRATKKLMK